jgi:hypothetical protein
MASYTAHYLLKKLGQGETWADESYKFVQADRDLLDHLAWLGAEGHHHTGGGAGANAPTDALLVQLVTTSGTLPAGVRFYYKFTMVDSAGLETAASPEVFINTPSLVTSPGSPTLTYANTGGALNPGNYYYVLSAYTGTSIYETPATNPEFLSVIGTTATNAVTVTFPALPSGATGFNVYRQAPGGPGYFFITSIDMSGVNPPTNWIDTGATPPNCDRTRPTVNTTRQTNSVVLSLPGVSPTLQPGQSWRIYRTSTANDYSNSLLAEINNATQYADTGTATTSGQPPSTSVAVGAPPQVQLSDSSDVQGHLPLSRVSAFPETITFSMDGDVFAMTGTTVWVCEYPQATIVGVRAALGRGYTPTSRPVIIDVNRGSGANPTMSSIFTAPADRPQIATGVQVGDRVVPTAVTELVEGDVLTIDVAQDDTAQPPTAQDLVVNIYLHVYGWTDPLSHVWATP